MPYLISIDSDPQIVFEGAEYACVRKAGELGGRFVVATESTTIDTVTAAANRKRMDAAKEAQSKSQAEKNAAILAADKRKRADAAQQRAEKAAAEAEKLKAEAPPEEKPKKRRGRPPGSKNKPKDKSPA